MTSLLESGLTARQHALLKTVLVAQTAANGRLEAPLVAELLRKEKHRRVLDIGCGEGSFLVDLARRLRATRFVGIDHNELAIADARRRAGRMAARNVAVKVAFFDGGFEAGTYDAVLTRYALQHASDALAFASAVRDRLKPGGRFIAVESMDAHSGSREPDAVWDRFLESMAAIHRRVGSDGAMGRSLGWLLRAARFREVTVLGVVCSPSTVGFSRFRALVRASAETAASLCPDLFDPQLLADIGVWLSARSEVERKDPYVCTAIASGSRP